MTKPSPSGGAQPLWTPDELASVTCGTWVRPPGPDWRPNNVRGVCLPVPVEKHAPMNEAWLPSSIMIVGREATLRRWFGSEKAPSQAPGGCLVIEEALVKEVPLPPHRAVLAVASCSQAMDALASAGRDRVRRGYIVITGTVGKTTTNRMLAHALSSQGGVRKNVGNYNLRSHVLQYTASIPRETDFGVFEMGLGYDTPFAFGEFGSIVRPDLVMLTSVDLHHLDAIEDKSLNDEQLLAEIAGRKLQLVDGLRPDGAVLINSGVPFFSDIRARLESEGRRVVSYGTAERSDARLLRADSSGSGTTVVAEIAGRLISYSVPVPGGFMAVNSLGAIAAAAEFGVDPEESAAQMASFEAVTGRAKVLKLTIDGKNIILIDDSYNATPLSMRATFELLRDFPIPTGARRVAVVGDINHWGERSAWLHAGLADAAREHGLDQVYTIGVESAALQNALPAEMRAGHYPRSEHRTLVHDLISSLQRGDVISVKASTNQALWQIVALLKDADPETARSLVGGAN